MNLTIRESKFLFVFPQTVCKHWGLLRSGKGNRSRATDDAQAMRGRRAGDVGDSQAIRGHSGSDGGRMFA